MHHSVIFLVMLLLTNSLLTSYCVSSNVAYLESPKKKNASNNLPDLVSNDQVRIAMCCSVESHKFCYILVLAYFI